MQHPPIRDQPGWTNWQVGTNLTNETKFALIDFNGFQHEYIAEHSYSNIGTKVTGSVEVIRNDLQSENEPFCTINGRNERVDVNMKTTNALAWGFFIETFFDGYLDFTKTPLAFGARVTDVICAGHDDDDTTTIPDNAALADVEVNVTFCMKNGRGVGRRRFDFPDLRLLFADELDDYLPYNLTFEATAYDQIRDKTLYVLQHGYYDFNVNGNVYPIEIVEW